MPLRGKIAFTLVASLLLTFSALEFVSAQCAIKPIKPILPLGCKDVTPQCVSNGNGQSYWTWICVPYSGGTETGPTYQAPAPRAIPRSADQNAVETASPVIVTAQTHLPISEDSKPAVETLRMIAQRIGECPKTPDGETQWGRKKDDIVRFYQEPPESVLWDVVAGNSVRAPYLGYVEFTAPESYWVPESAKSRFLKTDEGLAYLKYVVGPYHYRYEYDLGPDGLQLTRALFRNKTTGEWVEPNRGSLAKYCWDAAARDTQTKANNAQAISWLDAAEQGDAEAQYNLGLQYARGQGVPQDFAQAAIWFRKAADQNIAGAQYDLGVQYENGWGVPQNYEEAYFWLNLAAAKNVNGLAPEVVTRERNDAASHLTPSDLSSNQKRAQKWFEDHPAKPQ